ncbi:MAG: cell division protein FtsL [Chromatiales bacterium]|nr:cell division protein FtsL [Chromatiales bacterium]
MRKALLVAGLLLAVLVSALVGVWAKHEARQLFAELNALTVERDRLETDWGRLQIEHSTWASHARVEQFARDELAMRSPRPADIRLVVP